MPKYLINRVRTEATTYIVEADTEDQALRDFEDALSNGLQSAYERYAEIDVDEFCQSEGELKY